MVVVITVENLDPLPIPLLDVCKIPQLAPTMVEIIDFQVCPPPTVFENPGSATVIYKDVYP
jgi:hypothetical protein